MQGTKAIAHSMTNNSNAVSPYQNDRNISCLKRPDRRICVFTTASLPWRTGTSINALCRALYLSRGRPQYSVTLVIPWLEKVDDQAYLYGDANIFKNKQQQEQWIRQYSCERISDAMDVRNLRIIFYNAVYHRKLGCIFSVEDLCSMIPPEQADVAILEEPEHLNWFRVLPPDDPNPDKRKPNTSGLTQQDLDGSHAKETSSEKILLGWKYKFRFVLGILHTNYDAYIDQYGMGVALVAAPILRALSSLVVRAYCHRVIRLSDALPPLESSKELTCNVHGVRSEFFEKPQTRDVNPATASSVYFIGKCVWAKGFDKLLDIEDCFRAVSGRFFEITIYGDGNDREAIQRALLGRKGIVKEQNDRKYLDSKNYSEVDQLASEIFCGSSPLRNCLSVAGEGTCSITVEDTRFRLLSENDANPISIFQDISNSMLKFGILTAVAGKKVGEKAASFGVRATFSEKCSSDQETDTTLEAGDLKFDPPRSKFELRKHPVPAFFPGVVDHCVLRDPKLHKIFLNPSTSEVLCTTTAEALAMAKFAIIPDHESNTFFMKFTNCLVYSSPEEAVGHLTWALENDPSPLSPEESYELSWEGANARLLEAARMTSNEVTESQSTENRSKDEHAIHQHINLLRRLGAIPHLGFHA